MERHPRRASVLEIDRAWGRRLAGLRNDAGIEAPPELDVDHVRNVEATVGARIPDPLLALVAAGIPWLEAELGLSLTRFADHTARAREARGPGDFVGIAATSDASTVYGFRPGRGDDRIDVFDAGRRRMKTRSLEQWLAEVAGPQREGHVAAEPLEARLVRVAMPPGEGQRVRHRAWGEGRVLAEHGEGPTRKVKAEFPGLGLKVVQARFLEFLDE